MKMMILGVALLAFFAATTNAAQVVTLSAYSSGTNNDGNNAANATLIRVGQQDSSGTVLTFTGYTAFDLNASGLTEVELHSATYSLDFTLTSYQGSPTELTVEYLGTYASGDHTVANVNGGDQSSGWVTDVATNTIWSGTISAGNIVTTSMALDSHSFSNQYAVFRYSYVPGITGGSGGNIQWNIADSGDSIPQLMITADDDSDDPDDSETTVVEICIDFGATAPATDNWNQFSMSSSSTTFQNLIRLADGVATDVGLTVTGISGNGSNHLAGDGSSDSTIYVDHIYAQNESPNDTLTFTFTGLNDWVTYNLFGGFKRNHDAFEHVWTVGSDVRTNIYDGTNVDGYETFSGLLSSGGEFSFTISDLDASDDWASIAELTLTAIPTGNVPPTATAQSVSTLPETSVAIILSGNDWEGSNLTYSVGSLPVNGTLTTNGSLPYLMYTADGGYAGTDSFTFTVNDGEAESDAATVSISVTNELPVAYAQSVRVKPDTPMSFTLSGTDPEGSALTYTVDIPSSGELSGTAPDLIYTPDSGYLGSDSFTFTVNDGLADSDPATVSITVASNGPNFIIFFTDDHGYNDLGCFGSPHILTPRIDQMATEGMRFTDGYVASPVCGPSRAGLLTGSYPIRIAEPANEKNHHSEPHTDEITIPELLKTAGYTSALIGKWHNSGQGTQDTSFYEGRGPIDQGFNYFYGTPSHNGTKAVDTGTNVKTSILRADTNGTTVADADLTQAEADYMIYNYTKEAQSFMTNSVNDNQPFFLWLAHNMPHVSLGARQDFRDSATERGLDVYTAVIEELDWSLGEVLDTLDELGITENTFVIFSADNGPWTQGTLEGYYGSAFPLKGSKMRSLEGGPRVPFIVRWPGTIPTNTVSEEIVTTMDLFPTFMDYASVDIPDDLEIDGLSIRDLVEGTDTVSPHEYYYYYCYTYLSAIRDARWKLILPRRNSPSSTWMKWWSGWQDRVDEVQLYDLDNDCEETTNVAAQYPAVVKRLLEQVEVARAELGDKDRIGSGARFFDEDSLRPDIDLYNNNATQPYVDEPLTGLPRAEKTALGSAWVSYDGTGTYTSVELVWAYEDQGQEAASVWEAADGGGSADLGAIGSSDSIEYEITGLNPFFQVIFRFIFTDADGSLWSIPAPINPEVVETTAYKIGVDFSDGGSTAGSGSEPSWNVINGNDTVSAVIDLCTSNILDGVTILATGISGGELIDDDVGFGWGEYGNYLDTPFSDLSANDGVYSSSSMEIVISGVDDAYCYDVQVIAMPSADTTLTDVTIDAGSQSLVRTYASFRPYINTDPDPFTNSDDVLSSPFYSRPILVPAIFENVTTDGSGNLTITLSDDETMALNAIHITAKSMRPVIEVESSSTFNCWVNPVPEGKDFHVRQSTNLLAGFEVMDPALTITSETTQPLTLSVDPDNKTGFYRIIEGTE
jgi:arylsulfatase